MAWLTGWNYRKVVTISNIGSTLSDYQTLVTVDTASLIAVGKMRSDCGDIRFTASDGYTFLPYWIESGPNTTSTKIWIKIPSILAGTNTIYLYYSNITQTYDNSIGGTNTFDFFDDFESYSIGHLNGQGTWTDVYTPNVVNVSVIDSKKMAELYGYSIIKAPVNFGSGVDAGRSIVARAKCITASEQLSFGMADGTNWGGAVEKQGGYVIMYQTHSNTRGIISREGTFLTNPSMTGTVTGTYYTFDSRWYGTNLKGLKDGNEVLSATDAAYSTSAYLTLATATYDPWLPWTIGHWAIDYIYVHKYVLTEPTTILEAEQTPPNITATSITETPSDPCIFGSCIVTIDVTWTNTGGSSDSFTPSITIDGTPVIVTPPLVPVTVDPRGTVLQQFIISDLTAGTHTICPDPN